MIDFFFVYQVVHISFTQNKCVLIVYTCSLQYKLYVATLDKLFAVHLACTEFKPGLQEKCQALKPVFVSICKTVDTLF